MAYTGPITGRPVLGWLINEQYRMSLSRLQWYLWMVIVLSSLLTEWFRRLSLGLGMEAFRVGIPEQLLWAIGISSASVVGTGLILGEKKKQTPENEQLVEDYVESRGAVTSTDLKDLQDARTALRTAEAAQTLVDVDPASDAIARAGAEQAVSDAAANVEDKKKPLNAVVSGVLIKNDSPAKATLRDLMTGEEVGNPDVLVPTRLFNLAVTLALVIGYAMVLYDRFGTTMGAAEIKAIEGLPSLTTAAATLLTITHAAYLGDKAIPKEEIKKN
jgi:hypothetical protein